MTYDKMVLVSLVLLSALTASNGFAAGKEDKGFLDRVFKDADGKETKYVVFLPHDYKADKAYPLILFLHGAGEAGTDGQKQVKVGLGPAIKKREKLS